MSQIAVLKTRPQGEASAEHDLLRHGADAFVPRQFETRQAKRSKKPRILTRILCPGYVFTHYETREALAGLIYDLRNRDRPDVHRVLGTVRESDLEPLREIDGKEVAKPAPFKVKVDQVVRVNHGPFKDYEFKVAAVMGGKIRAAVGCMQVEIPIDHLLPNGTA